MAEQKRFYWIKLKENFFDLETIDWLISQKNGCEYIVLYQKLCLMSANKGGRLAMHIGEMIVPFDVNKIARDTKFDIDTVIVAMELFQKLGLVYEETDGVLKIPYVEEIVGSETSGAKRVREHRKRKALQCNTKCNNDVTQEKEYRVQSKEVRCLDKELEADAEKDNCDSDPLNELQSFRYDNVFLSDNQVGALLDIMDIKVFDAYVDKITNYPNVKNHYETILKWYNEDKRIKANV